MREWRGEGQCCGRVGPDDEAGAVEGLGGEEGADGGCLTVGEGEEVCAPVGVVVKDTVLWWDMAVVVCEVFLK